MLGGRRHETTVVASSHEALEKLGHQDFDLLIIDLTSNQDGPGDGDADSLKLISTVSRKSRAPIVVSTSPGAVNVRKAFKLGATGYLQRPYELGELDQIIEKALSYKMRRIENAPPLPEVREVIEIELPSDIKYLDGVLSYLVDRSAKYGVVRPSASNIFIALDEALTNAIRHGNAEDKSRKVYIRAEISVKAAKFTIRDEGPGFDSRNVPDPCHPHNLFKPSGRGLMLIQHIMDEVSFNECGNEVTMVKYPE
jgi:serine/threonine-protein kinase RsbW